MVRRKKRQGATAIGPKQKQRRSQSEPRSTAQQPERFDDLKLPDRRLLERELRRISGQRGSAGQEQAQDWLDRAYQAESAQEARQCALQALSHWPDCADAFCVLAELCSRPREAAALYAEGMAAGRRALGDEFDGLRGHFWGYLPTRPYMRAREGLALTLREMGRTREAADHLQEMLKLNPNDNQGARHTLIPWLLELDEPDELDALLEQYAEDFFAVTAWTRMLASIRSGNDRAETEHLLAEARLRNPHVIDFLLGAEPLWDDLPEFIALGKESEAAAYAASCLRYWRGTPGAITWLREATGTLAAASRLRAAGD